MSKKKKLPKKNAVARLRKRYHKIKKSLKPSPELIEALTRPTNRKVVDAARTALERADKADYDNSFVRDCWVFYGRRGFLSAKQIEALNNVRPRIPAPPLNWEDDFTNDFEDDNCCDDDWNPQWD